MTQKDLTMEMAVSIIGCLLEDVDEIRKYHSIHVDLPCECQFCADCASADEFLKAYDDKLKQETEGLGGA